MNLDVCMVFFYKPNMEDRTWVDFLDALQKKRAIRNFFTGPITSLTLGTKRGGLATVGKDGFQRSIHNLENAYFRSKFESDLEKLTGNMGIGVISDTDSQPIILHSNLGTFAVVTVGKIANLEELAHNAFSRKIHFAETSSGGINPSELVAMLICQAGSFTEGIKNAQDKIKGSCSMLVLTKDGLYAARDKLGRTPIIIGRGEDSFAASSESSSFSNLGFEVDHYVGPGEIIFITPEGWKQVQPPGDEMQVCSFLWVYYGLSCLLL